MTLRFSTSRGYSGVGVPYGGRLTFYNFFEGEYGVSITGLPMGYALKSIAFGTTDLGLGPLKIDSSSRGDLLFTLSVVSPK